MTGMTVHKLTQQLDAGDVIHQCAAELIRGDGVHQLAARAVQKIAEELPMLIEKLEKQAPLEAKAHKTSGMLWLADRWQP